MLKSTVCNAVKEPFNSWIESISDPILRETLYKSAFIAGGAILSIYKGEVPKDIDVYFVNPDVAVNTLKYYGVIASPSLFEDLEGYIETRLKIISHEGILKCEELFQPKYATLNTLTLSGNIQLIVRYTGTPEKIIRKFDYDHTKMYVHNTRLEVTEAAKTSILSNELIYNRGPYPLSSLFRLKKFLKRGWNVSAGQLTKLAMQLTKIDFTNLAQLKDQLYGIDVIRIENLIAELNKIDPEDLNVDLISELIDMIFDI